ncbi:MAG: hypothetical protein ACRDF9_00110 [Candidatus Limnocylindria bacterium]
MAHPLRIGLKLSQQVHPIEAQRESWRMADEAGFDHIWPFDHLIALGNDPTRLIFDGWTILGEHCAKVGRDPATIRLSSQVRAEDEDGALRVAETTMRAGFTELLLFPLGGGDLRSGVERAAALLPRIRALAR